MTTQYHCEPLTNRARTQLALAARVLAACVLATFWLFWRVRFPPFGRQKSSEIAPRRKSRLTSRQIWRAWRRHAHHLSGWRGGWRFSFVFYPRRAVLQGRKFSAACLAFLAVGEPSTAGWASPLTRRAQVSSHKVRTPKCIWGETLYNY